LIGESEIMFTFKTLKRIVIIGGILLSFFALIEVLHGYLVLRQLHPILGYAFALFMIGAISLFVCYIFWKFLSFRAAPMFPQVDSLSEANAKQLRDYCYYTTQYLTVLSENKLLPSELREKAIKFSSHLKGSTKGKDNDYLRQTLKTTIEEAIKPGLAKLKEHGEREVRRCVRDVMLAVTFSPYRSADLFIVLYRNCAMVVRLINIFNLRPRWNELIRTFWDIMRIVATVNYINVIGTISQKCLSSMQGMPFAGRLVDDLAQGFGAGFFTSITGHAAIERCSAFGRWQTEEAQNRIADNIRTFTLDVVNICLSDIAPTIAKKFPDITEKFLASILGHIKDIDLTIFVKRLPVPGEVFQTATATAGRISEQAAILGKEGIEKMVTISKKAQTKTEEIIGSIAEKAKEIRAKADEIVTPITEKIDEVAKGKELGGEIDNLTKEGIEKIATMSKEVAEKTDAIIREALTKAKEASPLVTEKARKASVGAENIFTSLTEKVKKFKKAEEENDKIPRKNSKKD